MADFTTPRYEKPTQAVRTTSIVIGVCGLLGGLIFLLIPLLGWIIGAIVIFTSFGMITNGISGTGTLKGECPYCEAFASEIATKQGFNCSACKKRVVIRDMRFYRVD